jgi:hypothetical protein
MSGSNGAAAAAAVVPEKVFVTRLKSGRRQAVKKEDEIAFLNMMEELLVEDEDRFAGALIKWELIARADGDRFADPRQLVGLGRKLLKADLQALFTKNFETDEDGVAYDTFLAANGGMNAVLSEDQTVVVHAKARLEWTRLASAYLNRTGDLKSINLLNELFFGLNLRYQTRRLHLRLALS